MVYYITSNVGTNVKKHCLKRAARRHHERDLLVEEARVARGGRQRRGGTGVRARERGGGRRTEHERQAKDDRGTHACGAVCVCVLVEAFAFLVQRRLHACEHASCGGLLQIRAHTTPKTTQTACVGACVVQWHSINTCACEDKRRNARRGDLGERRVPLPAVHAALCVRRRARADAAARVRERAQLLRQVLRSLRLLDMPCTR